MNKLSDRPSPHLRLPIKAVRLRPPDDETSSLYDIKIFLGHPRSIDAHSDQALDCDRALLPDSMSHSSTKEAVDNINKTYIDRRFPDGVQPNPVLIGHGNDGFFTTGKGDQPMKSYAESQALSKKYISIYNTPDWMPEMRRISIRPPPYDRLPTHLVLLSCRTGANAPGATLLHQMARASKHHVMAPTGLTFCSHQRGIYAEPGTQWQHGFGEASQPMSAIAPPPGGGKKQPFGVFLVDPENLNEVSINHVEQVVIRKWPSAQEWMLHGDIAQDVLQSVSFSDPEQLPGPPFSQITGEMILNIRTASVILTKRYTVHCGSLLIDQDNPLIAYRMDEAEIATKLEKITVIQQ